MSFEDPLTKNYEHDEIEKARQASGDGALIVCLFCFLSTDTIRRTSIADFQEPLQPLEPIFEPKAEHQLEVIRPSY